MTHISAKLHEVLENYYQQDKSRIENAEKEISKHISQISQEVKRPEYTGTSKIFQNLGSATFIPFDTLVDWVVIELKEELKEEGYNQISQGAIEWVPSLKMTASTPKKGCTLTVKRLSFKKD